MAGLVLSALVFAASVSGVVAAHRGLRSLRQLRDLPNAAHALPTLSVVVPALDEAGTIEPALRSLLAADYPHLQVVAIDDRSTDATGAILDRLAAEDPRLQVVHVRELPPGWLGKNHALQRGADLATGDWILFTDADVHFAPGALRRAVAHAQAEALDHLTVLPQLHVGPRQHLLAALLLTSLSLLLMGHPPWRAGRTPRNYIGMGAFNLVRASTYRRSGGHEALRLEVIDDVMLGRQLLLAGGRPQVLLGMGAVGLAWYPATGALVRGLEKNSFAAANYSLPQVVLVTAIVLLSRVWPWAGLLLTSGAAWWLNLGSAIVLTLFAVDLLRLSTWRARCLWWWPVAPVILLWILWRAVLLTLRRGGITWRGTSYPLAQLREFRRAGAR